MMFYRTAKNVTKEKDQFTIHCIFQPPSLDTRTLCLWNVTVIGVWVGVLSLKIQALANFGSHDIIGRIDVKWNIFPVPAL